MKGIRLWSLLVLVSAGGCQSEPALAVEEAQAASESSSGARWNEHCPMSGKPVDSGSYFEHEGRRVYFCNPHCAEEGAREPELWLARVYGSSE